MQRQEPWIENTAALEGLVAALPEGAIAVDTEADSMHHYPEKVCLVQLTAGSVDALIDPLGAIELEPLRGPLADPARRKLLHGADYDIRMLGRCFGLEICGLFDTMIAARLCGERAFGLAALLEHHLGVTLDKRFQRADWSQRPLTPEMQQYARLDTRHLADLVELLERRLEELGRTAWAQEEFERLEAVRWNDGPTQEPFRKIKGSGKLPRASLAALRELVRFREEEARAADRPPFKILRDDVLLELVQIAPETGDPLGGLRGLPRRWQGGRARQRLMEAWRQAWSVPREEWPERRQGRRLRRSAEWERRYREVADGRDAVAEELGLEPSLIASRAVLEGVVTRELEGQPWAEDPALRRWQTELLTAVVVG